MRRAIPSKVITTIMLAATLIPMLSPEIGGLLMRICVAVFACQLTKRSSAATLGIRATSVRKPARLHSCHRIGVTCSVP